MTNGKAEVLVVEDDPEINQLVGAYAQIGGFHYRKALDGQTALDEIHRHLPAMVILDLMLPDVDGFEVCRRIKNESASHDVPVLILTAMDREESRVRGAECGACAYMTKPFDPDQLIDAIRKHARTNGHPH